MARRNITTVNNIGKDTEAKLPFQHIHPLHKNFKFVPLIKVQSTTVFFLEISQTLTSMTNFLRMILF
ncbi:hypothetical protein AQUCO_08100029v1 [Aquilegia coerulea]|uniref:Uncharacterized protein n=1 Tax=Aquilegia coerulea TaxID=218851 RepID=A0A2G5C7S8_AQUCA|nr:hypothetical protein AQUCO_08100029v1 [Aquilegia coerulea]